MAVYVFYDSIDNKEKSVRMIITDVKELTVET